ncbi:MAG TPA: Uma2 family endonuclease [Thermoanaerobaculia bacterium]|jgi:Uma2 family endonuclease
MTVTTLMTADELLRMPDDGYHRYELVRGELRTMTAAGNRHSIIAGRILGRLLAYVEPRNLGEVTGADGGYWIARNPDTVRVPDVGFIRQERAVMTDHFFDGPPDLAVEVISPNDRYTEVADKTAEWLQAGTRAVVVVNPRRNIVIVHRPHGTEDVTDTLAVEDIIPGWRMPLTDVFR